jgi:hypothetical protein
MRIAKPILLVSTPLGVIGGIYEAGRFHAVLAVLMVMLVAVIGLFSLMTVRRIRAEAKLRPPPPLRT